MYCISVLYMIICQLLAQFYHQVVTNSQSPSLDINGMGGSYRLINYNFEWRKGTSPDLVENVWNNENFMNINILIALWNSACVVKTIKAYMQFVINFTRIKFQNNFLPEKHVNYDKLCFLTKQRNLNFHIINTRTQGCITLNKNIFGFAIIGLPKVNLWVTKCVTKRL